MAAAAVAVVVPALLAVAAPQAGAAQGCQSVPSFCAFEQPNLQGQVRTITDPNVGQCYDLSGPKLSARNDTAYVATLWTGPDCTGLPVSAPGIGQQVNTTLVPVYSVLFVQITP
ncbi:peptidase inhibitor family I36 protein [Actinosynnema sp. NPDC053489]|uniref:peptidase inhibitor family I36 protein n=1 Tax=Actinosynnema sp. NPDC053489 TaxID=3363916 RepID=UPI0037C9B760